MMVTRRNFLKYSAYGLGSVLLKPWEKWAAQINTWPDAERLGRINVGRVDIRSQPTVDAPSVGVLYEDNIVVWLREVIGKAPGLALCRRWVETPEG